MYYLSFDRLMGLWIINEFLKPDLIAWGDIPLQCNPLNPQSDLHLISSNNITPESIWWDGKILCTILKQVNGSWTKVLQIKERGFAKVCLLV